MLPGASVMYSTFILLTCDCPRRYRTGAGSGRSGYGNSALAMAIYQITTTRQVFAMTVGARGSFDTYCCKPFVHISRAVYLCLVQYSYIERRSSSLRGACLVTLQDAAIDSEMHGCCLRVSCLMPGKGLRAFEREPVAAPLSANRQLSFFYTLHLLETLNKHGTFI